MIDLENMGMSTNKISAIYGSSELQAILDRADLEELLEVVENYLDTTLIEIDGI